MGEVYRAHDNRLGRDVALKMLLPAFAEDGERVARFGREARALGALNHPHIGAIYGLEEFGSRPVLVLELVEGETLADRLFALRTTQHKGLSLAETLRIATQLAAALDAAHEGGIVHRDLKPANIKITPSGTVKVLDFGLAKAVPAALADETIARTAAIEQTREGVVIGTAAYMSPEQARGLVVDKRTDIWAFGCIVFEMLTGHLAFPGSTMSDVIAGVLTREPQWSDLPKTTPAHLGRLLQRCLAKDPKERLRDIGDLGALTADADAGDPCAVAAKPSALLYAGWVVAVVALAAAAVSFMWRPPVGAPDVEVVRSVIALPAGERLPADDGELPLAMSNDGSRLAFVGERDGSRQLFVRELKSAAATALPGTAGATYPFFSPDGQWVGFVADGALQKINVAGGAPSRICALPNLTVNGAAWGAANVIVIAVRGVGLQRVPADGGQPESIPGSGPAVYPTFLPDGATVLYTVSAGGASSAFATLPVNGGQPRIVARLADSRVEPAGGAALGAGGGLAQARYASGYLVYGQSPGRIMALPFDLASLAASGAAVPIEESAMRARSAGGVYFAASQNGTIAFATIGSHHQLVWVDRQGRVTPVTPDRQRFRLPRLSPDARSIAVAISDDTRRSDLWIYDAVRGTRRRLTSAGHNLEPYWVRDGSALFYSSGQTIRRQSIDGGQATIVVPDERISRYPSAVSADGRTLLMYQDTERGVTLSSWFDGQNHPLDLPGRDVRFGALSPDGHWLAYSANESGRSEVYVARYPELTERTPISSSGGTRAVWARDGRELFYRQGDAVVGVKISLQTPPRVERPLVLFSGPFSGESQEPAFDVAPDGRFLMVLADEDSNLRQLQMTQHWTQALR